MCGVHCHCHSYTYLPKGGDCSTRGPEVLPDLLFLLLLLNSYSSNNCNDFRAVVVHSIYCTIHCSTAMPSIACCDVLLLANMMNSGYFCDIQSQSSSSPTPDFFIGDCFVVVDKGQCRFGIHQDWVCCLLWWDGYSIDSDARLNGFERTVCLP